MGLALGRLKAAVKANPLMLEPDFRRLWIAATFNATGMAGEMVILGLLVYRITGTSEWVGISLAIYYMPLFIFGTLSGAVADWMDRRRLLRTPGAWLHRRPGRFRWRDRRRPGRSLGDSDRHRASWQHARHAPAGPGSAWPMT